ncbi:MAG TPA: hypothetical protein VFN67_32445, partial [Polyangiales bacterium]|nr:hypothetical protein [Polyangiales bacterium]
MPPVVGAVAPVPAVAAALPGAPAEEPPLVVGDVAAPAAPEPVCMPAGFVPGAAALPAVAS